MGGPAVGKRAKVKGESGNERTISTQAHDRRNTGADGGFSGVRKEKNGVYEVGEVGMAAFSVFFMQDPSFLEHQRVMKESTGRNNAEHLFGLQSTPSDNEIRITFPDNLCPIHNENCCLKMMSHSKPKSI